MAPPKPLPPISLNEIARQTTSQQKAHWVWQHSFGGKADTLPKGPLPHAVGGNQQKVWVLESDSLSLNLGFIPYSVYGLGQFLDIEF